MRRRTGAAGTLVALASAFVLAHPAHAQDLDCADFTFQEEAQAVFDLDTSDPNRLDEEQGPDDGRACEVLPRRSGLTAATSSPPATATATSSPTPTATATAPSPSATTRGVRGGVGGSSEDGPSGGDLVLGGVFVAGAALATGYWVGRRRT
jgi:hypothetical protein